MRIPSAARAVAFVFAPWACVPQTAVTTAGSAAPSATCPAATPPAPTQPPTCQPAFGEAASFAVDKAALRARGASPKLIAKLESSAYRYFRLLGPQFAGRSCFAFRDVRWRLPFVAVHGDAHVEQLVVTRETSGLEDYDQAGFGPIVVDLVRYGASLHMACREVAWACRADEAVDAYFKSYREALEHPPERKMPKVAERIRGKTPLGTEAWLRWADTLMRPLPAPEEAANRRDWAQFARQLTAIRPDRPAAFYDVVRMGALEMGIGSAMEKKVLFRIRGATEAPADDLILEARSSLPPNGSECVWRPAHGGSLHALMFMSLLGPRMPDIYGFVSLDENPNSLEFWVQSWDPGYRELSISDLEGQGELVEVAEDAGRQLAGHFWTRFPEPLRLTQRYAQLRAFDMVGERAKQLSKDLAAEVVVEWERFKRAP